jgi:hypothetical protein
MSSCVPRQGRRRSTSSCVRRRSTRSCVPRLQDKVDCTRSTCR